MEENQNSYQIASLLSDSFKEIWKTIYRINDDNLGDYKKLGDGAGPIEIALAMAFKYCPYFYERVVGYTVSENGIGQIVQKAIEEKLPDHPQVKAGGFTYTFYERHIIRVGGESFVISPYKI